MRDFVLTSRKTTSLYANGQANKHFGKNLGSSFQDLDIFQVGGVIFF